MDQILRTRVSYWCVALKRSELNMLTESISKNSVPLKNLSTYKTFIPKRITTTSSRKQRRAQEENISVSNSPRTNSFTKLTLLETRPWNSWTYKIDQASENGRLYSVGVVQVPGPRSNWLHGQKVLKCPAQKNLYKLSPPNTYRFLRQSSSLKSLWSLAKKAAPFLQPHDDLRLSRGPFCTIKDVSFTIWIHTLHGPR
jgi:hypothetical protein